MVKGKMTDSLPQGLPKANKVANGEIFDKQQNVMAEEDPQKKAESEPASENRLPEAPKSNENEEKKKLSPKLPRGKLPKLSDLKGRVPLKPTLKPIPEKKSEEKEAEAAPGKLPPKPGSTDAPGGEAKADDKPEAAKASPEEEKKISSGLDQESREDTKAEGSALEQAQAEAPQAPSSSESDAKVKKADTEEKTSSTGEGSGAADAASPSGESKPVLPSKKEVDQEERGEPKPSSVPKPEVKRPMSISRPSAAKATPSVRRPSTPRPSGSSKASDKTGEKSKVGLIIDLATAIIGGVVLVLVIRELLPIFS